MTETYLLLPFRQAILISFPRALEEKIEVWTWSHLQSNATWTEKNMLISFLPFFPGGDGHVARLGEEEGHVGLPSKEEWSHWPPQ